MRRTFGVETNHNAIGSMEGLRGIPHDLFPSGVGALLTNGVPDRSAPLAPKPRSSEPITGKSA
jgi:hypothetical protein